MEHPCEKCGTPIEDGVAFCPQCNAPQIRVVRAAEANQSAGWPLSQSSEASDGDHETPAGGHQPSTAPPNRAQLPLAVNIEWREALPGATLAGMLLAVAWLLPFARIVLWMLVAGGLAAALYQRRRNVTLSAGQGGRIGAISGLLGFAMFAVTTVFSVLGSGGRQVRTVMQQALQQAISSNTDPRAQEMLRRMDSPSGIAAMIAIGMVFFAAMFVAMAALGGAMGAVLFSGRRLRKR